MSARQLDAAARILASGLPRRQVIRLLTRAAVGGAAVVVTGSEADAKPSCRGEGHPCEGNQTCCPGLTCAESGKGAARRCTAGGTSECQGDCPTAEPDVIVVGVDIDIEADCAYSGEMQRSTCTFTARAGVGTVESLTVLQDSLCAAVAGGDFLEVAFGASAQPTGAGLKSTRQEEGAAVVTIELDGEVTTAATATYWCETDSGDLVPVTGPGLRCAENAAPTAVDVSNETGAIVVYARTCDVTSPGADVAWFDACQAPATHETFQLARLDGESSIDVGTQPVDASGVCRFGQLPPGTYRLEQTNGDWCHAESNSVDDQGNVVVEAAGVATVWIFHCTTA